MAKRHRPLPTPRPPAVRTAATTVPAAAQAWQRGTRHFKAGDLPATIAAFREAVHHDPQFVAAFIDLGACLLETPDLAGAQAAFASALALAPDNLLALENLGTLWVQLGNFGEAVACLERVHKLKPADGTTLANLEIARAQLQATAVLSFPAEALPALPGAARIALCLIARNAAQHLPALFESVRTAVDEILLVDTGSTDATVQLALQAGARVEHFAWIDDFAAAKNFGLQHTSADWVLHLDADMALAPGHGYKLRRAVASGLADAYTLLVQSPHDNGNIETVAHAWLFKNGPHARFSGAVHEQIYSQLRAAGVEPLRTDILAQHFGYLTAADRQLRKDRDLHILEQISAGSAAADNPLNHFYLGRVYFGLGRHIEAASELRRYLEIANLSWRMRANASHLLAESLSAAGQTAAALNVCTEYTRLFPHDRISWTAAGQLYLSLAKYPDAVAAFERALAAAPAAGAEGIVVELSPATLLVQLGRALCGLQRWAAGAVQLRAAVAAGDASAATALALGHALRASGAAGAAGAHLQAAIAAHPADARLQRELGLALLAAEQPSAAVPVLERARELAPLDADVLNDLGAAYANSNQFLPAMRAFGAALKLAPHNPQALHNLSAILMQAGENAKAEVFLQQARQMEAQIRT